MVSPDRLCVFQARVVIAPREQPRPVANSHVFYTFCSLASLVDLPNLLIISPRTPPGPLLWPQLLASRMDGASSVHVCCARIFRQRGLNAERWCGERWKGGAGWGGPRKRVVRGGGPKWPSLGVLTAFLDCSWGLVVDPRRALKDIDPKCQMLPLWGYLAEPRRLEREGRRSFAMSVGSYRPHLASYRLIFFRTAPRFGPTLDK